MNFIWKKFNNDGFFANYPWKKRLDSFSWFWFFMCFEIDKWFLGENSFQNKFLKLISGQLIERKNWKPFLVTCWHALPCYVLDSGSVNQEDPIAQLRILTLCSQENTKLYREQATSVTCRDQTKKEKACQIVVDPKQDNNSINGKRNPEKKNHGLKVRN